MKVVNLENKFLKSTLVCTPQEGHRTFQHFCAGEDVTKQQVENLLNTAGVKGRIKKLQYGYYRKVLAWLEQDNGNNQIAKICLHPYSMNLLRNEAKGYSDVSFSEVNEFLLPDFCMAYESSQCSIALMNEVKGSPLKFWHFPDRTMTSIPGVESYIGLSKYLDSLFAYIGPAEETERLRRLKGMIQQRFGERLLPLTSSHGDFVYWNLLRSSQGSFYLFDFEYYRVERASCFDDWHWFIFPLGRKAIRLKLEGMLVHLANRLPNLLWNRFFQKRYENTEWLGDEPTEMIRLLMAVYLLEQSVLMCQEHQIPEIVSLIGIDAYSSRQRLLRLYEKIIVKVVV